MSFHEKSAALMLAAMVVVYGWYFATVASGWDDTAMREVGYKGLMLATVLALIAIAIAGHILIALLPSYDGDVSDERDRIVGLRSESLGGFVLGTAAVAALFLSMAELDHFWIANTILLGLVLGEVIASVAKLVYYRRMA